MSLLDLVPAGLDGPVACSDGAVHRVRWDGAHGAGGLRAVGHEASDEAILAALGGTRPPCVELCVRWRERRVEPLLVAALLSGDAGLLSRQTVPSVGGPFPSPVGTRSVRSYLLPSAFYESVKPFLDLPAPLRRVLAVDAASAFSATDLLQRGVPDNTSEVGHVVRSMLRSAAEVAFGQDVAAVSPRLLEVSGDVGGAPVLFVRGRRSPVELAGRLSVAWVALAVLGLAVLGDVLVVSLTVPASGSGSVVRGRGFRLVGRDGDLTPVEVSLPRADAERRVALALFS